MKKIKKENKNKVRKDKIIKNKKEIGGQKGAEPT